MLTIHALDEIILRLCKNIENPVIGYKGGCVEKKLLDRLQIESINIETLGCPTIKNLPIQKENCGHHNDLKLHCPQQEVRAFFNYINNHILPISVNFSNSNLIYIDVSEYDIFEQWD